MTLTADDKKWLKSNCGKVERLGLYLMVIVITLRGYGCHIGPGAYTVTQGTNVVAEIKR